MSSSLLAPAAARRTSRTGLPYLVASGVLWGTGGLLGTLLGRAAGLAPAAVATYRLLLGGLLLAGLVALSRRRVPGTRAAWTRIAVLGLLSAGYQVCYFEAVSLSSVSLATLVTIGISPVLVLVAQPWTFRHEDADARARRDRDRATVAVVGLALGGLGLLVGLPSGPVGTGRVLASAGLALLAAAGFATVTLLGARPVAGLDDRTAVGFAFTTGGLLLIPFATATGGLGFTPGVRSAGLLAALALGPTAVAYALYFRGLRAAGAGTGAVLALLEPLTGALLAAVVLGERLGVSGIAGAVLLAAAVVITASRRR